MSGFEAWTETGYAQLSADFRAFHLRHRIDFNDTGAVVWQSGNFVTRETHIRFQANTPMVAWVSHLGNYGGANNSVPSVGMQLVNEGNGNWLVRALSAFSNRVAGRLWVYDSFVPTGTNSGIELYLPDGSHAYSSGSKPMRVVGVSQRSVNVGTFPGNEGFTIPPGRQIAAIQSARYSRPLGTGTLSYWYGATSDGVYNPGGGIYVFSPSKGEIRMPTPQNIIQNGAFIYVDVTGH
ncbi:hypothetical protein 20Sep420_00106 [Pseudomonas phage 20Sep420]|nr:hypothetical protein 20Sep420_00106 [Pseudomonas phage 20Sep420]